MSRGEDDEVRRRTRDRSRAVRRGEGANRRVFVAAYPDEDAARRLRAAWEDVSRRRGMHEGMRVEPPDRLHLTLMFVGDTPEREMPEVVETVRSAARGVARGEVRLTRVVTLPRAGAPRLAAAVGEASASVREIQRRLSERLARRVRERGEFLPHVTLARWRAGAAGEARGTPMDEQIDEVRCGVGAVRVMVSVTTAGGTEHRMWAEVALEG
jgi:2'-5' RNA ligase